MRKKITQTHIERLSVKYLTSIPQNCQVSQKQGKSMEVSQQKGGLKRHEDQIQCGPRSDSATEKGH